MRTEPGPGGFSQVITRPLAIGPAMGGVPISMNAPFAAWEELMWVIGAEEMG